MNFWQNQSFQNITWTVDEESKPVYITYLNNTQPAYVSWQIDDDGHELLEGYVAKDSPIPGSFYNPINLVTV